MKAIVPLLFFALSLAIPAAYAGPKIEAKKAEPAKPHKTVKTLKTVKIVKTIKAIKTVTYLGVETGPVQPALRSQLDLPKGIGLLVTAVAPGSPAEKAGVKAFDVLHKLDDQLLVNAPQLEVLIQTRKPGSKVTLTIIRKAKPVKLPATLASRKVTDWPGAFERLRRRIPWQGSYRPIPMPQWRMPKMPKVLIIPDSKVKVRIVPKSPSKKEAKPAPKKHAGSPPKKQVKSPPKKQAKPGKGPSTETIFTLKTPKYTVTVRGLNGDQTATVTGPDGKVLHKGLRAVKWDTLPEDMQRLLKGICWGR